MRFSFWIGNSHPWDEIVRSARHAEGLGFDGLWFADHFMPNQDDTSGPMHEVWTTLSGLAMATEHVRLGPLVCGNTYRHPAVLMKQAVTADHVSGGRIVLGMGAGWQENEHVAYGLPFETFRDRFEWFEESLQILRSLRDNDVTDFDGARYQLTAAPCAPKPVGSLPILIGGGGEKKSLRLVAQYAEEWNVWATPETMAHKVGVLHQHCERLDRDPASVHKTAVALLFLCDTQDQADKIRAKGIDRASVVGTPEEVVEQLRAFAAAGTDEFIIPDFTLGDPSAKDDVLARFVTEVRPHVT